MIISHIDFLKIENSLIFFSQEITNCNNRTLKTDALNLIVVKSSLISRTALKNIDNLSSHLFIVNNK